MQMIYYSGMAPTPPFRKTPPRKNYAWNWLLMLPAAGLLFPAIYNRATPTVLGFPFFYWYQFVWIVVTALISGLVYVLADD
jgi:hypothetical protein